MKSNLKKLRIEAGLSMDDLAGLSGTCKSQIHALEKDSANPTLKTANNLSIALSCELSRIVYIEDIFVLFDE